MCAERLGDNRRRATGLGAEPRALAVHSTFERSVYLSRDGGQSWGQIADRGAAK
jgi:hypothetical protein